jgi:antitoxin MazE
MPTRTKIVKIGNSQGVRIPKALIEQANLGEEVELLVEGDQLVLRSPRHPRAGWGQDFARMAAEGEDQPVWPDFPNAWDEDGWEW